MQDAAIAFAVEKGLEHDRDQLVTGPFALWDLPFILPWAAKFFFSVRRTLGPARNSDDVWTAAEELSSSFRDLARRASERRRRRPATSPATPETNKEPPRTESAKLMAKLGYAAQSVASMRRSSNATAVQVGELPPFVWKLGQYLELLPVPVALVGLERYPHTDVVLPAHSRKLCASASNSAMDELIAFAQGLGSTLPPPPWLDLPEPMDVRSRLQDWARVRQLRAARSA